MPVCLVLAVFSLLGSAMSTKASAWDKPWFCHGTLPSARSTRRVHLHQDTLTTASCCGTVSASRADLPLAFRSSVILQGWTVQSSNCSQHMIASRLESTVKVRCELVVTVCSKQNSDTL